MPTANLFAASLVALVHFVLILFLLTGWVVKSKRIRKLHLVTTSLTLLSQILFGGACPLWLAEQKLRMLDAGTGFLAAHGINLGDELLFGTLLLVLLISLAGNFLITKSARLKFSTVLVACLALVAVWGSDSDSGSGSGSGSESDIDAAEGSTPDQGGNTGGQGAGGSSGAGESQAESSGTTSNVDPGRTAGQRSQDARSGRADDYGHSYDGPSSPTETDTDNDEGGGDGDDGNEGGGDGEDDTGTSCGSWTPDPSTVCSGQPFNQTNNCDSRSAVGTKNCTTGTSTGACTPGEWSSSRCAICLGDSQWGPTCTDWGTFDGVGGAWCACQTQCQGSNSGQCIADTGGGDPDPGGSGPDPGLPDVTPEECGSVAAPCTNWGVFDGVGGSWCACQLECSGSTSGQCVPCVDSSWSPDPSTRCYGDSFTQTSNCDNTRSATGTADCTPPSLNSSTQIFAADNNKSTTVTFADSHPGTPSGMASASVTITGPTGTTTHSGVSTVSISRDFGAAGDYDLSWSATDNAGNSASGSVSGFFHVVANVPEWSAGNCTGNNYQTTCPSSLSFSSGTKIADSVDYHTVTAKLVDVYGNRVVTENGIKDVQVNFNFSNSTDLDQIAGTGDSARYTSSELSLTDDPGGSNTGWSTEPSGGNGEFELRVHSYAPTSSGYALISGAGINLDFTSLDYEVVNTGAYASVGATAANYALGNAFAFSPTLISTPALLNWDGSYALDASAIENISINAGKRMGVRFTNNSSNGNATTLELGLLFETTENDVLWADGFTESPGAQALSLDNYGPFGGGADWNNIAGVIASVGVGTSSDLRIVAQPELAVGKAVPEEFATLLETYVGYTVNGKQVRHVGESVSGSPNVQNPTIEIIGAVRSSSGVFGKQSGASLNQSIGDTVRNELKAGITRNVAGLTESASVNGCFTDVTINDLDNFISANPSCVYHAGTVLFFEDADVTLELNGGSLPGSVGKTLLVSGGNVQIKGNITYSGGSDALGIVVLEDDITGTGGDIYVYPNVTDVVGAWYAEGGVVSVNSQGQGDEDLSASCDGSSGFCDRTYELRNQLFWKGLLATGNTLGGSDQDPVICPGGVSCARDQARKYDLAYLRTYTPDSTGSAASGVTSTAALVIQYDSRIQNNPPPLFEISTGVQSEELGSWLLRAIKKIWE